MTLAELVTLLERDHGERFARSAVHRFVARRADHVQKRRRTPASRSARTWQTGGRLGSTGSPTSTPSG
jgi:transposase